MIKTYSIKALQRMEEKLFSGTTCCSDGELYEFTNGVAVIPGFKMKGQVVKITIREFIKINKSMREG